MKLVYTTILLLLVILAGVVVHAPITIWLGTILPGYALEIKAWKEILLLLAIILLMVEATRRKLWRDLLRDRLIQIAVLYAVIHGALLLVAWQGLEPSVAGLMINLRFIAYMVAWYVCLRLIQRRQKVYNWAMKVAVAGAVVVAGFGLLQVTVLPRDILASIGYSDTTIQPYQTIDSNPDYVRINSTLRGPNPLGMYASVALVLVAAFSIARWQKLSSRNRILISVLAGALLVALAASYSRSAAGTLLLALGALFVVTGAYRWSLWRDWRVWLTAAVVAVGTVAFMLQSSDFVANVILHDDPDTGAVTTSNSEHIRSFVTALGRVVTYPFGHGVGTTGSASLLGDGTRVVENYYLMVGYELGVAGLLLFISLYGLVLYRLWRCHKRWLCTGLFASGVGIAVACLVLPVWADDTVALVWWGLAGIALGMSRFDNRRETA